MKDNLVYSIREEKINYQGIELTVLFESYIDINTGEVTTDPEQDNTNLDSILAEYEKIKPDKLK